jgi:hypothetical protein
VVKRGEWTSYFFSSFDTEMVQPPFVRTGKELALHRRRAIKGHAAREAKRTDNAVREAKRTESLKRRASLPQNRTFECEDPADFCAQLLKDALNAVKDALVVVERVIQKNTPQDKPAVEQVLAYPGEASADQPFMQELFANWDAKKIAHSVAEAALGRPAPGSWVWVTSVTAQNRRRSFRRINTLCVAGTSSLRRGHFLRCRSLCVAGA